MSTRLAHKIVWRDTARQDLDALAHIDLELVSAARQVVDDLAHHHIHGKQLGARHVSGDLTGLYRVCFDVTGERVQRFRLIYDKPAPDTVRIIALGPRAESAIYRLVAQRRARGPEELP